MAAPPLAIKLRCTSWEQLARLHERDLARGALFLKSQKPPPVGTEIRIDLTIPSGTTITLDGRVARLVPASDRGAGVDLMLAKIPASDRWVIESALAAAGFPVKSTAAPPPPPAARPATPASISIEIPIEVDDPVEEPEAAAAEFDLVQALEAELAGLRAMNPFQILGVTYEADDGAVRAAFNELTKKYHPDRFARYESETARALAGEIFILVREAYRRLGDAQARAGARAAMKGQPPAPGARGRAVTPVAGVPARALVPSAELSAPTQSASPRATPRPPVARSSSPGGQTPPPLPRAAPPVQPPPLAAPPPPSFEPEKVLSFRNTGPVPIVGGARPRPAGGASSVPLDTESLFGDLGDSQAGPGAAAAPPPPLSPPPTGGSPFLARGEQMLEAGRYDDAYLAFDAAARSNAADRVARVGRELARGFQRLSEGDRIAAAQCFEAALEIDPMNERAARELSAMRRAATDARRGLLGKLLGKRT